MLYTQADFDKNNAEVSKKLRIFGILFAAYIIILGVLFYFRLEALTSIATFVLGCPFIFFAYVYLIPPMKYKKFLKEMQKGREHVNEGCFQGFESAYLRDGIMVRPMVIIDDEGFEHRSYWDEEKPLPNIEEGVKIKVTTYGQNIKNLEIV